MPDAREALLQAERNLAFVKQERDAANEASAYFRGELGAAEIALAAAEARLAAVEAVAAGPYTAEGNADRQALLAALEVKP